MEEGGAEPQNVLTHIQLRESLGIPDSAFNTLSQESQESEQLYGSNHHSLW